MQSNPPEPWNDHAEAYGDVAAACVDVAACDGITLWGIRDPGLANWDSRFPFSLVAPNVPMLWNVDVKKKPAYRTFRDALLARATGQARKRHTAN